MNTKWNRRWLVRAVLVSVCALVVCVFLLSWGKKTHAQNHTPVHMTTDWSNRHMVYSPASSMGEAWKLQTEPRYVQQWVRHTAPALQSQDPQ